MYNIRSKKFTTLLSNNYNYEFITLITLVSVNSASEAIYEYNNNEIQVNKKYNTSKSNYRGHQPVTTKKSHAIYVTVAKYRFASTVTAYKTINECSKPPDNLSIYIPSVSKPNYPVLKSAQPYGVLFKLSSNPAYPESNKSSSEIQHKPSEPYPNSDLDEGKIEILCRVNGLHAEVGKKSYKIDQRLMKAAQLHSGDQALHKKISHIGTKIKTPSQRIKTA